MFLCRVISSVNRFAKDQNGAVQVEWIVLVASIVGISLFSTDAISAALGMQGEIIIDAMQARVEAGLAGSQ